MSDIETLTSDDLRKEIADLEDQIALAESNGVEPMFVTMLVQDRRRYQAELGRRNGHAGRPSPDNTPLIELMESVEREEVDFLWWNRIPRGKLTDFSGDPGIGKSTAASQIAATISRGLPLPFDREPEAPLRSLIVSSEDTPSDVLKPRLEKMHADMSLIAIPNQKLNLIPSQIDAQMIDDMLTAWPAALLIVDPIIAYTGSRNTNKASDVREFLGPLTAIAYKHRTAVIMVRHFTKDPKAKALYRSQGSIDFAAVCRSAFVFGQDQEITQRRLMAHVKHSLGPLQQTIEFFIEADGAFRWGIENDQSADEITSPGNNNEARKIKDAVKFLQETLGDKSMPSNEIKDAARKAGVSWATVWKAKDTIEIKPSKEAGVWFWRLP